MSLLHTISLDTLTRLVGTPACLTVIDIHTDEDFAADPRLVPRAVRRGSSKAADRAAEFDGRSAVVVIPQHGLKLRDRAATVPVLEGGTVRLGKAALPTALGYAAWPRSLHAWEHFPAADAREDLALGKGFDVRRVDLAITHQDFAA